MLEHIFDCLGFGNVARKQNKKNKIKQNSGHDSLENNKVKVEKDEKEPEKIENVSMDVEEHEKYSILEKLWHQVFHKYSGLEIFLLCTSLVLVIVTVITINFSGQKNEKIEEKDRIIETLNNQLAENLSSLTNVQSELDEANNQVQLLSESLNSKSQEIENVLEDEKLSHVPSAYPLKGTAAIIADEDDETEDVDDEEEDIQVDEMEVEYGVQDVPEEDIPTTYFMTGADTRVVAAGVGRVLSITEDAQYGYCIEIDHENGYVTTYKGYGIVLVDIGDLVMQGGDIMRILDENMTFQYRICYNGEYIDPMTCMEING